MAHFVSRPLGSIDDGYVSELVGLQEGQFWDCALEFLRPSNEEHPKARQPPRLPYSVKTQSKLLNGQREATAPRDALLVKVRETFNQLVQRLIDGDTELVQANPQNLDLHSQLVPIRDSPTVPRACAPISAVTLVMLRCLMLRDIDGQRECEWMQILARQARIGMTKHVRLNPEVELRRRRFVAPTSGVYRQADTRQRTGKFNRLLRTLADLERTNVAESIGDYGLRAGKALRKNIASKPLKRLATFPYNRVPVWTVCPLLDRDFRLARLAVFAQFSTHGALFNACAWNGRIRTASVKLRTGELDPQIRVALKRLDDGHKQNE
ncbi:hypothetical protein [Variovorax sp. J31P207]|uniref:hypothetical protein n=1 Tax=Variovorax sp. J31P207 TaxID=3053510 RepID=UPI002578EE8A|nr:hypothetical protein [Variovorax sp. J31P207]MDM0068415.1 hypothetical protein [Variovorax sp. J31P207]